METEMRSLLLAIALLTAGQASAQALDPSRIGALMGADDVCDLDFDDRAVKVWIRANVPLLDFSWFKQARKAAEAFPVEAKTLKPEQLTVRCTDIEALARSLGFLR
jgi:hypothetical protein